MTARIQSPQLSPGAIYASMTGPQRVLHHNALAFARQKYVRGGFFMGAACAVVVGLVCYVITALLQ